VDDTNSYDQRPDMQQRPGASTGEAYGRTDERDYLGYSKNAQPFEREERWEDEDNMFDGL